MSIKKPSYGDEVTDFINKEILRVDSNYTCLAVITLSSTLKNYEIYYLQVFSKDCKCIL